MYAIDIEAKTNFMLKVEFGDEETDEIVYSSSIAQYNTTKAHDVGTHRLPNIVARPGHNNSMSYKKTLKYDVLGYSMRQRKKVEHKKNIWSVISIMETTSGNFKIHLKRYIYH